MTTSALNQLRHHAGGIALALGLALLAAGIKLRHPRKETTRAA